MKNVTSVSGGRTSAYLAANYPADECVFALVRIEDQRCRFPDEAIRRHVEDRIGVDFIATAEDDKIIYTMLDLEQELGRRITWVSGRTYEWVLANSGGWLPNKLHRYCTSGMKIEPIFYWWAQRFNKQAVEMNIGFRSSEAKRANKMLAKTNEAGLLEMKATFSRHPNGDNRWEAVAWQKPRFPLIEDGINKDAIMAYWQDRPVRFAEYNNCVGCFNRHPLFLKYMFSVQPEKMRWFKEQERPGKGTWRSDVSYADIERYATQMRLYPEDFSDCDSGYCEL